MSQVRFTRRAEQDLEDIADYIAADNPERAGSFLQELRTRCGKIGVVPLGYPARPELGEDIRACPHGRYVIFFKASPSEDLVIIVRILHGARDLGLIDW